MGKAFFPTLEKEGEQIGEGGFGQVYRVGSDMAIKVLRPGLKTTRHYEGLRREAQVGHMAHEADPKRFPRFYPTLPDFAVVRTESDGLSVATRHSVAIAMEWMDGRTLGNLMRERGRLPEQLVLMVALEISRALGVLNENVKVVHRDLKPENIMLDMDGGRVSNVRLFDFGMAHSLRTEPEDSYDCVEGAPAYCALEAILDEVKNSVVLDLYSLGAIMYEGLTGEPYNPCDDFRDRLQLDLARRVEVDLDETAMRDSSDGLKRLVGDLLHNVPARRPQSAGEVEARVRALL